MSVRLAPGIHSWAAAQYLTFNRVDIESAKGQCLSEAMRPGVLPKFRDLLMTRIGAYSILADERATGNAKLMAANVLGDTEIKA